MDRQKFLKLFSAGTLFSSLLIALTGCAPYRYVNARHSEKHLEVSKNSLGEEPFVLVRYPEQNSPIYLGKRPGGSYRAIFLECTHKQCTVNPTGELFTCPCHASKYDLEGRLLKGPARQDLYSFKVTADADTIYIHLPT